MFTSVEDFQSRRMFGIEVFPFCRVGLKSLEVLNMLGVVNGENFRWVEDIYMELAPLHLVVEET